MKRVLMLAVALILLAAGCGSGTTYQNSRYGYSFTYDDNVYKVSNDPVPAGSSGSYRVVRRDPRVVFGVDVLGTEITGGTELTFDPLFSGMASVDPGFRPGAVEHSTLDGVPALRSSFASADSGYGIVVLARRDGVEYQLEGLAETEAGLSAARPELERMIASFRFQ